MRLIVFAIIVLCLSGCATVKVSTEEMNRAFNDVENLTDSQAKDELISYLKRSYYYMDYAFADFISLNGMIVRQRHYATQQSGNIEFDSNFELCGSEFKIQPLGLLGTMGVEENIVPMLKNKKGKGLYFNLSNRQAYRMYALVEKLCGE